MSIYYVYVYFHPHTNVPFYVGYGKNTRYLDHLKEAKRYPKPKQSELKLNTIRKILRANSQPVIKIIDKNLSKECAVELEIFLIESIGQIINGTGPLTNIAPGGDGGCASGVNNPNYGNYWTDEQRQDLANKNKGNKSRTGMKNSEEAKMKQSYKARNRPLRACPHCNKIGASSQMGRWHFDNCKFKQD